MLFDLSFFPSNYYRSKDSKVVVHAKTIIPRSMSTRSAAAWRKGRRIVHINEGEEEDVCASTETTLRSSPKQADRYLKRRENYPISDGEDTPVPACGMCGHPAIVQKA
ncbi:hypothetical protein FHS20_001332 [Phyllobacterium endophyticum]|uniref:hypothetical protein n=1 Tax=Phyllobacterium endophyticum TaxID=1149773 RepID=UPI00125836E4|nr:hypothetical protein [Phyllobacterium endophyticum]MBB3234492.1 hypothetical protein [Phyllobacterium endophyticum]TYR38655.1 hypothetical protein FY050_21925 [Phyllobacterium endophyticum]